MNQEIVTWCDAVWPCQNVKAVFDTAIKVVLQPPRRREVMAARKKTRRSSGCSIK
jgi:Ras-related C3 botulinum toxin substrate 1